MQPSAKRFYLLDALRGVAAILVVQRHTNTLFGTNQIQSTYLAVDLFFVLSGFVLANAYQQKLKGQISFGQFITGRAIRLLPMYWIGLGLMIIYFFREAIQHGHLPIGRLIISTSLNAFFIPIPMGMSLNGPFILGPSWSLFGEAVANIIFGALGRRLTTALLVGLAFVGAIISLYAIVQTGSLDQGFEYGDLYAGIGRVFYSFFVGILIYRCRFKAPTCGPLLAIACILVTAAALCLPVSTGLRPFYDIAVVGIVFPAVVAVSWSANVSGWARNLCEFLGDSSYPVYVLHVPLASWLTVLVTSVFLYDIDSLTPWIGIFFLIAVVPIAYFAEKYLDLPLRRAIRNSSLPSRAINFLRSIFRSQVTPE